MRFRTRVFLLSFLPFALLLAGSFWAIQSLVQKTVRNGLQATLRENQISIARLRSRSDLENSRFLKIAGENAALKAGVQLLLSYPGNTAARATVEDQLGELCERMGFDFLMVSDASATPLAGVARLTTTDRRTPSIAPITGALPRTRERGLLMMRDRLYQIATVPLDQGDENIGSMSVGEAFDFGQFSTPTVLRHDGQVINSSIPGIAPEAATAALRLCAGKEECDVRLGGVNYLSLPMQNVAFGDGYELRSLQNVDSASAPVQQMLHRLFVLAGFGALGVALIFSVFASRTVVRPIMAVISHLRRTEGTGLLPEFERDLSSIREVRELTASFNRAAGSIRDARESLQRAYVEFVGSLASALDARDPYTAGHSRRVSALSCATAMALGMEHDGLDEIRIGALLHDIGKIGISDTVLGKAGKLTNEEFALIKQHPEIGCRILQGVHGFSPYLAAVELHHENWDGSGYPRGQRGEETPLAARIIHVVDAYDAMTTDRPYRRGMSHEKAISVLEEHAGRQFDPRVVAAFTRLAELQHLMRQGGAVEENPVEEMA
jgi:HD-GYP domain-containing protein (c-di-GMP phosphodiesterase class II)